MVSGENTNKLGEKAARVSPCKPGLRPTGLGTKNDCAGEGQQRIKPNRCDSRFRGEKPDLTTGAKPLSVTYATTPLTCLSVVESTNAILSSVVTPDPTRTRRIAVAPPVSSVTFYSNTQCMN
jgi:hypothetical protein